MSTFAPRVFESYLDSRPHPVDIPVRTLSTFQPTPYLHLPCLHLCGLESYLDEAKDHEDDDKGEVDQLDEKEYHVVDKYEAGQHDCCGSELVAVPLGAPVEVIEDKASMWCSKTW